jgi:predicted nucleotidyltransferase
MSTTDHITDFLNELVHWAASQPEVKAVGLVGSYAREAASPDSDIDIIILAEDPGEFIKNTDWLKSFGLIKKMLVEDYGRVTSLRAWYENGREVEFGLTTPAWAGSPLEDGTERTIQKGMQVLFERELLLSPLLNKVQRGE